MGHTISWFTAEQGPKTWLGLTAIWAADKSIPQTAKANPGRVGQLWSLQPLCRVQPAWSMKDPGLGKAFGTQFWLQARALCSPKSIPGHTHVGIRAPQRSLNSHLVLQG